jgi:hypothetical protein
MVTVSGLRRCNTCGVVLSGQPEVCPVCTAPFDEQAVPERAQDVDLRNGDGVDLRSATDSVDTAEVGVDTELATSSVGGDAGASRPVRTRPKTPLRPYVPPTAPPVPFGAGTTPTTPPLPTPTRLPRRPTTPTTTPFVAPGAPAADADDPGPTPPTPPAAIGWTRPVEPVSTTPPWAAVPPPSGRPFTGIVPPGAPTPPPAAAPPSQIPALPDRPDPYAQIANPLHTGWGETPPITPPTASPPETTAPASPGPRARWVRRAALVALLALLAGGIAWQRDRIGDLVQDLGDRIDGEGAAPAISSDVDDVPEVGQLPPGPLDGSGA